MATGGKRPGAGRKKGIRNKTTDEVKQIINNVAKKHGGLQTIFEKLFELTEGIQVREFDKKGVPHVYDKPPDAYAARTILEFRFGRPEQSIALEGDGTSFVQIVYEK